jgi:transcriptional regulator
MDRMMRMILPFRLRITSVDGTWKLNQNKTAKARAGVVAALGPDHGIAQAMRALDE